MHIGRTFPKCIEINRFAHQLAVLYRHTFESGHRICGDIEMRRSSGYVQIGHHSEHHVAPEFQITGGNGQISDIDIVAVTKALIKSIRRRFLHMDRNLTSGESDVRIGVYSVFV
jgi:hypothetical protein